MANPFDQFDDQVEQNPFDQFDASETIEKQPEEQDKGFLSKAADVVTGESRMTPEMESLSEIGNAPELNELSWGAFKTSLGLLATGDEEKSKAVIKSNVPEAQFRQDEKGNTIVSLPSGEYALNKPGISGQDIARGIFDIAAFTPAGRASTIAGAGIGAGLTEAGLQAATQQVGGGDVDSSEIIASAALGAGGKIAENVLSTAYRAAKGRLPQSEKELVDFAEEQGLPLTTTDVVQPETFAGKAGQAAAEKIPVAGTGAMRAEQQKARQTLVEDFSTKFGEYNPSEIVSSLTRQTSKVKKAAGNTRGRIINQIGDIKVTPQKTIDAIDQEIDRLSKLGEVADTQTIDKLTKYKNQLQAGDGDFNQLEQIRTQFRQDVKGERVAWPGRSEAATNRIYKSMTDDMSDVVESNLSTRDAARWRKSNAVYASEANKIKNTRLKSLLNKGELTPEVVNSMLFSNKPSEIKSLYSSLDSKGKAMMRVGIIGKAFDKSGRSPDKFLGELNRLSKQTDIVFKGKDKEYLNGLKNYLEATKRAAEAGVRTPTGQELFQIAAPSAVVGDIMTTGGVGVLGADGYGILARAYESKPIRNMILKLNSIPKGSTEFESTIKNIQALITAESQSQRRNK